MILATNSGRVAHRDELNPLARERFARSDGREVMKLLSQARIANAGVNDVAEFLEHPVLRDRNRWRDVRIPGAVVQALISPADLSGVEPRVDAVHGIGEHTDAVLTGIGFSEFEIASLRAGNVI
ncbi:CoA transferase [Saccharopolyspora gloriosae]|uniref:CoA transferase n=1 Tax=Saccharopolyspora gloriosae TaxID=455344 RepID=UPI001FB6041B|nr:CoA transferase [Saccharopolyspora gloriosae]